MEVQFLVFFYYHFLKKHVIHTKILAEIHTLSSRLQTSNMHAQGTYGVHKYRSKFIWKMCELLHVVLSSHFFAPTRKDSCKRGEKSLFNKTDFSFRGLGNNTFFFFFLWSLNSLFWFSRCVQSTSLKRKTGMVTLDIWSYISYEVHNTCYFASLRAAPPVHKTEDEDTKDKVFLLVMN